MSALESFRAVAAAGAALATVGMLLPARFASPAPRRVASLCVLTACWLMLGGSLLGRDDVDSAVDRLGSPVRAGAIVIAIALGVLLVRVVLRKPIVWLVLLALALPIRVPVTVGTQSANLLLPLYGVVAIGVVAVVWATLRGRLAHTGAASPRIDLPLAAFVAFSAISLLWSDDITEATVKLAFFYLPFVILYRLVVTWWAMVDTPLRPIAATTVGLGVVGAAIAIFQFATETIWWNDTLKQGNIYNRFFRANGIFFDPNMLGRFLVICIVAVIAYMLVTDDRTQTWILTGAVAVMAAGLVVTFSRSSALALMVALAILSARVFGVRRVAVIGLAGLVLVGGPAVALNENVREKATSIEKLAGSSEGRWRLTKGGLELWRDEPVAGVGLGAFAERYKASLPKRQQARTRVFISHTAPVTVLAELGAVGFALLLVLVGGVVSALWRGSRAADPDGLAIWTMLALIVAIFVHSLLYSAFFEDPYLWVLTAAGGALAVRAVRARAADGSADVPGAPDPAM